MRDPALKLDLRQLRYFLALCEAGTYGRAAEQQGISQSALTQSILRLEQAVGVRLFERGRSGATLTAEGRLLLPRAQSMLAEAEAATRELRHARQARRAKVAIGLGKSIVGPEIPDAIGRLRERHPEVALTIREGWSPELFALLLRGRLDFVVSAPLPHLVTDLELRQEELFRQQEAVILGRRHPLAGKERIELADLARCLWVLPLEGSGRMRFLRQVFADAGLQAPADAIRSDSSGLGTELVRRGLAVAHGVLEVVRRTLRDEEFRVVPIPALSLDRPVYLTLRRRMRLHPAALRVVEEVRAACATRTRRTDASRSPAAIHKKN